ncbi:MAG: polyprenyl synthetase family protein [Deltaproteobacteria bacterium]|jgi:geranylgeranyl diphosphate synthase type II|nr:polyprenyl synthetase family protein [Deltaproteobacteria bacterium]
MNNINDISVYQMQVESFLQSSLATAFDDTELWQSIKYTLTVQGKRIRPVLVLMAAKMLSVSTDKVSKFLLAIEYLHNSSLIHDDLPALDNDDYRRGKPTCHKVYGESTALLAGDALIVKAFSLITEAVELEDSEKVKLISLLTETFYKICLGQVLDLKKYNESLISLENRKKALEFKQLNKTAALITTCLLGVFLLSSVSKDTVGKKNIISAGQNLGLLFQATDDILDSVKDEISGVSKDEQNGIDTYVTIFGLEKTKQIACDLAEKTKKALDYFGEKAGELKNFVDFILYRKV